ncbi:MFS transporter [Pseudomonas fluorescens]|uniref:MFS transporter n=1 Tax=Pseudomonas fluorescens TaxID=294 RepID=A0A944DVN3_PSEFL|nr:MFS transporter [Pseudomonas fluorescens]MBT2298085.1 MFS transporter [Pseudomonas fluorescens]MBT2309792.1 MFS transporter [Pseudomonas fluorescens]MBT2314955.1 MFS transporter [Pseudomonas fluorescens]MBT2327861.1 MFS transporter [Pseudomonas fluorescens]MBT2345608.1 MFS transporter [Pseudomonas fluorescens]
MDARKLSMTLWVINLASIAGCTVSYVYLSYYLYNATGNVLLADAVLVAPMLVPILLYVAIKKVAASGSPRPIFALANAASLICAVGIFLLLPRFPMIAIAGALTIGFLDALQRVTRIVAIKRFFSGEDVKFAVPMTLTAQFIAGGLAGIMLAYFKGQTTPMIILSAVAVLFAVAGLVSLLLPDSQAIEDKESPDAPTLLKSNNLANLLKNNPLLKSYLMASIVFVSVFQGFFNISRVTLPAHQLGLNDEYVGYLQILSSLGALIGAVAFYFYNKTGRTFSATAVRLVSIASLAALCAASSGYNVASSYTAYFAYMFMWELMFFNYEANVVNACSSADMAHVATYQYAASYFGIISVTLAGGLLTQYLGLLQTALILSALYLCYMLREAYSSNSQHASSLVKD